MLCRPGLRAELLRRPELRLVRSVVLCPEVLPSPLQALLPQALALLQAFVRPGVLRSLVLRVELLRRSRPELRLRWLSHKSQPFLASSIHDGRGLLKARRPFLLRGSPRTVAKRLRHEGDGGRGGALPGMNGSPAPVLNITI